jgi:hypothetical protein
VNRTRAQLAERHWLVARPLQSLKHPQLLGVSASAIGQIVACFSWGR